ncbi:YecA family protein [Dokdonella sp. MW10]|uniref:YecA family protein n=1 Tax=Dokdonella sp. MW10 TaxID=2992926 RepID=UPI003F7E9F19
MADSVDADALESTYSRERLLRTEAVVLLGLLVQQPINLEPIDGNTLKSYAAEACCLMEEAHEALNAPIMTAIRFMTRGSVQHPSQGDVLREAIFYGPPSAYHYQFLDFAPQRYERDREWLVANKGFSIDQAARILGAIHAALHVQVAEATHLHAESRDPTNLLPAFVVRPARIAESTGLDPAVVGAVFGAFELKSRNERFRAMDDYNEAAALPLVPLGEDSFLILDPAALNQSLYESPIFWMRDTDYESTACEHRGASTEGLSVTLLQRVFGAENVHANVKLKQGKTIVDEVDVLVVYGDRCIVLQAKSKGLTIGARKGDSDRLKSDFKAAVRDGYAQALSCAAHLVAGDVALVLDDESTLQPRVPIKEIFPFCVVADHYPSLSFQTRSMLQPTTTDIIREPFVMDVFLLDAMTEMLRTPLRLLAYVKQRAALFDRISSGHELTVLSYHLSQNLVLPPGVNFIQLGDDIGAGLEAAMMVRRMGLQGPDTPPGILTRFRNRPFEHLIGTLEHSDNAAALELGFELLSMGSHTAETVDRLLVKSAARSDEQGSLCSFRLGDERQGLTVQVGHADDDIGQRGLRDQCALNKYECRADKWFGAWVDRSGELRAALLLDQPWTPSAELEKVVRWWRAMRAQNRAIDTPSIPSPRKQAVNALCACGSGKKYKKCCMRKRPGYQT